MSTSSTPPEPATPLELAAMTDSRVTEYRLVHPDESHALDWASIEPCAAGGFKVWASASAAERRYGSVARFPLWRPDAEAARAAAWDMVIDLLFDWTGDLKPDGFAIQAIDDEDDLIAEVPVAPNLSPKEGSRV